MPHFEPPTVPSPDAASLVFTISVCALSVSEENIALAPRGGDLQPCFLGVYLKNGPRVSAPLERGRAKRHRSPTSSAILGKEPSPPFVWAGPWTSKSWRQVTHLRLHVKSMPLGRGFASHERACGARPGFGGWLGGWFRQAVQGHTNLIAAAGSCATAWVQTVEAVDAGPSTCCETPDAQGDDTTAVDDNSARDTTFRGRPHISPPSPLLPPPSASSSLLLARGTAHALLSKGG